MNILQFIKNNEKYIQDFITRSTYHSNAIEGNTLTYSETYAILYNDNSFKIQNREPREIYEAINHKAALEIVFEYLKTENELSDKLVKNINETINKNVLFTEGYRKVQVFISSSEELPPSPEKIPNLMNYYIFNYNGDQGNIFEKIAKYHIEFEKIHPFEDGNGRTGRILMNFELIKNNLPPIVISKDDRVKYFEFIRNNDSKGFSKWIEELSNIELERINIFSQS